MTPSDVLALSVVVASNVGGQLLFKAASNQIATETDLFLVGTKLIHSPALWTALALYGLTVIAWIWVLRTVPLSVAYSAVGFVFVLVPALSTIIFKEPVSPGLVVGTAMIAVGVFVVQFYAS
jgi:multidrug transporter EmrE-like cation transporter